jgi:hypothetical protein
MSDTVVTVHARLMEHHVGGWAQPIKLRDMIWKKVVDEEKEK